MTIACIQPSTQHIKINIIKKNILIQFKNYLIKIMIFLTRMKINRLLT
jgi:hypothetical protein